MTFKIIISRVPYIAKLHQLVQLFKSILNGFALNQFRISNVSHIPKANEMKVVMEFYKFSDATKASKHLNNFLFKYKKIHSQLSAEMCEDSRPLHSNAFAEPQCYKSTKKSKRLNARLRDMDRKELESFDGSCSSKSAKLDLEIELLKKQREVFEEKRKLLEAQRKLEMIREYGPGSHQDYDRFKEPRKRRSTPPPEFSVKKGRISPSPAPPQKPAMNGQIPAFFKPCQTLLANMKRHIKKKATPEEVDILVQLIRASIRKDLAIALDGKDYISNAKIISMYRQRNPKYKDEALVDKILANIRASYLPTQFEAKDMIEKGIEKKQEVKGYGIKDTEIQNQPSCLIVKKMDVKPDNGDTNEAAHNYDAGPTSDCSTNLKAETIGDETAIGHESFKVNVPAVVHKASMEPEEAMENNVTPDNDVEVSKVMPQEIKNQDNLSIENAQYKDDNEVAKVLPVEIMNNDNNITEENPLCEVVNSKALGILPEEINKGNIEVIEEHPQCEGNETGEIVAEQ